MHVLLLLLLGLGPVASSDHDVVSVLPTRPASAGQLNVAAGTVMKMVSTTHGVLETTLTLREDDGRAHQYLLSNVVYVEGRMVTCFESAGGLWKSRCSADQVGVIPGKTCVAVLYWPLTKGAFVPKDARGADTIVIVSP